jgi:hypothetical protein
MKTFSQFLEQVGHTHQTPSQQTIAMRLDMSKRRRHSNIVSKGVTGSTSYDKEKEHNIKDIEDRRS